ncbi:MAG: winged helix-turn-helix transcriptional regulator [Clostridia bacterium]|nr:winged helix-turn-helix transcriptional regulator [Clostridia bacterium]
MVVRMLREPVILFETLGMLCKYFRNDSYTATADTLITKYGVALSDSQVNELRSNAAIADQFMNAICFDLDRESEDCKFFFEPFETGDPAELNCVARVLLLSIIGLKKNGFDEAIEETKRRWSEVKSSGLEVLEFHMHGMNFESANGRSLPSLFEQIYALDYPQKAKMDTFRVLEKHEYYIDKLADIMRPYALRMQENLDKLNPIYAFMADNWEQYLRNMPAEQVFTLLRIDEKTQIHMLTEAAVSLFLFNEIGKCFDDIPASPHELTTLYIGIALYPEYTIAFKEQQAESIADRLKALADPVRMAILARLQKNPDYCLNISQTMDLNPGNVSRHLTQLYENGLVFREKRDGRIYFGINYDAIKRTFDSYLSNINKP